MLARIEMLAILEFDAFIYGPYDLCDMYADRIYEYQIEIINLKRQLL